VPRRRWAGQLAAIAVALGAAALVLLGTAGLAFQLIDPSWFETSDVHRRAASLYPSTTQGIFARNLGSLLLLYSGTCTLGMTSVFSAAAVGGYLGAFVKLEVAATGWGDALHRTGAYSVFEITGFLVACTAGLVPIVSAALRPGHTLGETARRYWSALSTSFNLLIVAVLLVLVGAVVESSVIGA